MSAYNPDSQLIDLPLINCRELGGMPLKDGHVFRSGLFLRSGSPSELKTREEFGTTLVMVTHDLAIADRADRIFRMDAGEIKLERDYLPGYKPLEVNRTIRR